MNDNMQKQYVAQLNTMYQNGQKWRREHPSAEALIAWNFPPDVAVIAPISLALEKGYVRTNPAGLELLKALWPDWDSPTEPTILMCRAVLELKHEVERRRV